MTDSSAHPEAPEAPLEALPVEFLFRLDAETMAPPPIAVPGGPYGDRLIVTASGGAFAGPRLAGRVVPGPGAEWATGVAGGGVRADVRLVLETDDGVPVLMTYQGVGTLGESGSLEVRIAPLFQVAPGPYEWLNSIQAVGLGTPLANGIRYDVYRVR